jgi:hypothetical protein
MSESLPKYPAITVQLSDVDGNIFYILGKVTKAMRRAGLSDARIKQFSNEARSGDYDHALQTCMKWVNVE